ncbi:MAG: radical SAM protein, partial [Candidatus Aminicenantes bacterium]|nr:radical SAM protein [Candidatus Aminicenantes bacterium]
MMLAKNLTICLINLGCAKNLVDSEVILGRLASSGYILYPEPEGADIIIINTCGFIEASRQESQKAIRLALKQKKLYPSKIIGVIGCYVEMAREQLAKLFPQIDFWLGVKELGSILEAIEGKKIKSSLSSFLYNDKMPRILSTPPVWAYLKIAEGCSHCCSFCTIPSIKGPYRSRSIASIVREAQNLVALGVKEINLISQDTTYFGRDRFKKPQLGRLLEEMIKIPRLRWIRWLYGLPEEVDDS